MVKLNVFPKFAIMDDEVNIIVNESEPNSPLTISASIAYFNVLYLGYGHFYSDAQGHLNMKENISYGGTYKGLQPMGLFTSARAMPSKYSCPILIVRGSVEKPLPYKISVWKGHLTQDQIHQLHIKYSSLGTSYPEQSFYNKFFLIASDLERTFLSPKVKRIPIDISFDDGPICGVLFLPTGNGPFPGVINMHGATGSCPEFRAALIAKHGFACLALAYFNYENLKAETLSDVQMSYFDKVINWFSRHSAIVPGGVSMIGHSIGAEIALLASFRNAHVRSVVCINSSIFMESDPKQTRPNMKNATMEIHEIWHGLMSNKVNEKFESPRPLLRHKHDTPILFITGEDDFYCSVVNDVIAQLKRSGKKNVFKNNIESQGHMIEPPYTPASVVMPTHIRNLNAKSDDPYQSTIENLQLEWGGNYEKNGKGQVEAWRFLLDFLHKNAVDTTSKL